MDTGDLFVKGIAGSVRTSKTWRPVNVPRRSCRRR